MEPYSGESLLPPSYPGGDREAATERIADAARDAVMRLRPGERIEIERNATGEAPWFSVIGRSAHTGCRAVGENPEPTGGYHMPDDYEELEEDAIRRDVYGDDA